MVIEAAINGQAEAIVTHNRRDFIRATERFGIEILAPTDVLKRIGQKGRQS
jgi:predicted nucleic acid-binding protein